MPRYIDAEKIDTRERGNNSQRTMWWTIKQIVDNVPTADVQEVVRCKDCQFRYTETCFAKHETADDDYCSNGARMGGGVK